MLVLSIRTGSTGCKYCCTRKSLKVLRFVLSSKQTGLVENQLTNGDPTFLRQNVCLAQRRVIKSIAPTITIAAKRAKTNVSGCFPPLLRDRIEESLDAFFPYYTLSLSRTIVSRNCYRRVEKQKQGNSPRVISVMADSV